MPYPVSFTEMAILSSGTCFTDNVMNPCGVYLMALDIRLLTTMVMTSESKYISGVCSSMSITICTFLLTLSSWKRDPIPLTNVTILSFATVSFLCCVCVFRNSNMSLMSSRSLSALACMLLIFFAALGGSAFSAMRSSRGPSMRVSGVRSSCVMLVKKRMRSSFSICLCSLSHCVRFNELRSVICFW